MSEEENADRDDGRLRPGLILFLFAQNITRHNQSIQDLKPAVHHQTAHESVFGDAATEQYVAACTDILAVPAPIRHLGEQGG
ncbi:MAG TPA: hypothetical protein VFB06_17305 [Streptosporangiaceae bacterium]|nr:hypothetical protein [Streptosporangiaceae bacterium]